MDKVNDILRKETKWENLHFYQKAKSLYSITFYFAHKYLTKGDRTIDQMIQAARSGKQNIVEGSADGVSSTEMELKLLNVARASIKELREDYEDYLNVRGLVIWTRAHPGYDRMLEFCRQHDSPPEYERLLPRMSDEKIANMSLTLCHFVDKMLLSYQSRVERRFLEEGGIRERMTAARLDMRGTQKQRIAQLEAENTRLRAQVASLQRELEAVKAGLAGNSG